MNISSRFGNNNNDNHQSDPMQRSARRGLGALRKRPPHQKGWKMRQTVLHHRLKELLVFEINRDGTREYRNMTLRALYNYVLAAIATRPKHLSNPSTRMSVGKSMLNLSATSGASDANTSIRGGLGGVDSITSFVDSKTKGSYHGHKRNASLNTTVEHEVAPDGFDGGKNTIGISKTPAEDIASATTRMEALKPPESTVDDDDDDDLLGSSPSESQHHRGGSQVSFRATTTAILSTADCDQPTAPTPVTYRERLGAYLHPRDMRRLVTPFSASNEPEMIVRRHVVLLNFDPLRAIVLRDRLLVLVPDGADSILETLSQRIKGGLSEMEDSVFGKEHNSSEVRNSHTRTTKKDVSFDESKASTNSADSSLHSTTLESAGRQLNNIGKQINAAGKQLKKRQKKKAIRTVENFDNHLSDEEGDSDTEFDAFDDDEWNDMQGKEWASLPFELQSVDAVLHTVTTMLIDEANELQEHSYGAIEQLLEAQTSIGEHGHDLLRSIKGEITQMRGRVQGFVRAINLVLDEDEDMALMNLSRLITHPERFIQPVPEEVLHEESDEPELILEAYLQQSLSNTNALDLLRSEVVTTEELMNMKLDTVRNRLLYVNTVVSALTLCVGIGSFIGSIFGMNLPSGLEVNSNAFRQVVLGTCFGSLFLLILLVLVFYKAGITLPGMS